MIIRLLIQSIIIAFFSGCSLARENVQTETVARFGSTTTIDILFEKSEWDEAKIVRSVEYQIRDGLFANELLEGKCQRDKPIDNRYLVPMGDWETAKHEIEGTLSVAEIKMNNSADNSSTDSWNIFPGFTIDFFTCGKYLVPVPREIINKFSERSYYNIIMSPGTVWYEPDDNGLSRGSFPFTLVNEQFNIALNGLATFVFDDKQVSSLYFQVTQETSPLFKADFWGISNMDYKPSEISNKKDLASRFLKETKSQIPVLPFSSLAKYVDENLLQSFNEGIDSSEISSAGLLWDDTLYLQPCYTRYGNYPYYQYMRYGAYSLTKAMGALVAILRLAEKYGEQVFDLKIADYVEIKAAHNGWQSVTFADALNMATGIGDNLPEKVEPNVMQGDEDQPKFISFLRAKSKEDKMDIAFSYGNYPWGPGEVARYNSINIFILSAAMDAFLKSKEGPAADIWDMVTNEVLEPMGIYYLPVMRTVEPDKSKGLPIFGYGLYPNVNDIAKISVLFQNNGFYKGQQLLHSKKLSEALFHTDLKGLPTGERTEYGEVTYHLAFNGLPYYWGKDKLIQIPVSTGFGGNHWVILPNKVTTFRFCDGNKYGVGSMIHVAESVCDK